eukprot:scaffold109147_cov18-Tisochrysis_lutea.AAC.2
MPHWQEMVKQLGTAMVQGTLLNCHKLSILFRLQFWTSFHRYVEAAVTDILIPGPKLHNISHQNRPVRTCTGSFTRTAFLVFFCSHLQGASTSLLSLTCPLGSEMLQASPVQLQPYQWDQQCPRFTVAGPHIAVRKRGVCTLRQIANCRRREWFAPGIEMQAMWLHIRGFPHHEGVAWPRTEILEPAPSMFIDQCASTSTLGVYIHLVSLVAQHGTVMWSSNVVFALERLIYSCLSC